MTRRIGHLPEYAIEAAFVALFLLSATAFTVLLEHPDGPFRALITSPLLRRALMGLAMGVTAALLIYSPLGARSGAHMNPAVTLAWTRLGRVSTRDAMAYIAAQFAGATLGMAIAWAFLGMAVSHPSVGWVATHATAGIPLAFLAELSMTFMLMLVVLVVSNHPRWNHRTGLLAAAMVAFYITVEAPVSGMSINPARSFGPAILSGDTSDLWVYLSAPTLGALLAAEAYARWRGVRRVYCAKFNHHARQHCIFACRFESLVSRG